MYKRGAGTTLMAVLLTIMIDIFYLINNKLMFYFFYKHSI